MMAIMVACSLVSSALSLSLALYLLKQTSFLFKSMSATLDNLNVALLAIQKIQQKVNQ